MQTECRKGLVPVVFHVRKKIPVDVVLNAVICSFVSDLASWQVFWVQLPPTLSMLSR